MSKLLLVEGYSDVEFFKLFCQYHQLNVDNVEQIDIKTPKDIDLTERHNGKQSAIKKLDILLNQVSNQRIERLGVIVDADFIDSNGLGFKKTHQRIADKLAQYDYELKPNANIATNQSNVILPDIGVWIMPNHYDDGAIEHWLKENIHQAERKFYDYVNDIIEKIEKDNKQKFKSSQQLKVKIGTWLLWQKEPHSGAGNLFDKNIDNLIDRNGGSYQELLKWFENVFGD